MPTTIPIILDTDLGSDIDDAVALAYLLRQPRCELVGVTTVSGDTAQRAACGEVLCREMGRTDIPIHPGLATPLLIGPGQPNVPHYAAIKHREHRLDRQNFAVQFLRNTIRQNPGQITLLSIGPLTNVAALFAMDPEIPWMLKSFVSMAGIFFGDPTHTEWNVKVDPIASAIVYKNSVNHVSFGLDVTTKCQMPPADVRARFAPKPLNVVLEMAEVWFQHAKTITFHDPLAAVSIFEPDTCTYATGTVTVPIDPNEKTAGQSLFVESATGKDGKPAPHRVAKTVDSAKFFENYFKVF